MDSGIAADLSTVYKALRPVGVHHEPYELFLRETWPNIKRLHSRFHAAYLGLWPSFERFVEEMMASEWLSAPRDSVADVDLEVVRAMSTGFSVLKSRVNPGVYIFNVDCPSQLSSEEDRTRPYPDPAGPALGPER